ncbi:MT-A70 family methyltransferase [Kordiimonas marina]|uniref:MT-A70 family methyltransferase n=1 Tax=Kordiimonas marina TaxID=2872312 RepID=UPI001FF1734E|nr:MT-A70 family methyltransferase [Kordiimonas marina]MCJ9428568.1 hypothetical protein [Kordiimonas marina]
MTVYTHFQDIPYLTYDVLEADPAWPWKTYSDKGLDRSPERHYSTMTVADIEALPVADIAKPDSVLFLWITAPVLAGGRHKQVIGAPMSIRPLSNRESVHLSVMEAWGFECKALAFVWVKTRQAFMGDAITDRDWHRGMGKYTAQNAELCFVGTRGRPPAPIEKLLPQIITDPAREHSRKPETAHDRIRRMYGGKRIELFSRQERPGFDAWGNQVDHFERMEG